jgi:hypothetical protein
MCFMKSGQAKLWHTHNNLTKQQERGLMIVCGFGLGAPTRTYKHHGTFTQEGGRKPSALHATKLCAYGRNHTGEPRGSCKTLTNVSSRCASIMW